MMMHVITNFAANAGAETMLSRLLHATDGPATVVSLIDVSERNRKLCGSNVRFESLGIRSLSRAATGLVDLSRIIARDNPRVIVCWMYHAMVAGTIAARLSRKPIPVFWNIRQSIEDPSALSGSTRVALQLSRRLSSLTTGIIYNSARAEELHRRIGFCSRNVAVIPNGFSPVVNPPPVSATRQVFGIAARLHPQKDHETFFQAAALLHRQCPQTRFIAAGAGLTPDNPSLAKMMLAAGLPGDAVDLRGEIDDMDRFYRDIDVLVLSSRTEGFPNVVAEAMSYGKPVVTTDVGDSAATVGGTGIVVPPGNPQALADGMRKMLGLGTDEYAALSTAARERIDEHFSLPQVVRHYDRFLNGLRPTPNGQARLGAC
jgi:glycosyltransferase involved in cell wall biosynthesis